MGAHDKCFARQAFTVEPAGACGPGDSCKHTWESDSGAPADAAFPNQCAWTTCGTGSQGCSFQKRFDWPQNPQTHGRDGDCCVSDDGCYYAGLSRCRVPACVECAPADVGAPPCDSQVDRYCDYGERDPDSDPATTCCETLEDCAPGLACLWTANPDSDVGSCVPCVSNADCEDGNLCTENTCNNGVCEHEDVTGECPRWWSCRQWR